MASEEDRLSEEEVLAQMTYVMMHPQLSTLTSSLSIQKLDLRSYGHNVWRTFSHLAGPFSLS
jgi:hypothetical protein